jgi:hypothetical protein
MALGLVRYRLARVDQMSVLFGRDLSVIRGHGNVFRQGERPDEENYRQNLPVIDAGLLRQPAVWMSSFL